MNLHFTLRAALLIPSILSAALLLLAPAQANAQRAVVLVGKVTVGSKPIPDVSVRISDIGTVKTDSEGRFRFENLIEGRKYSIYTAKQYYRFSRKDLTAVHPATGVTISGTCDNSAALIDGLCWPANPARRDRDGDGLSDAQEDLLRTDPRKADTDGDDRDDGQEVTDGTHPLDRGSFVRENFTRVCADTNGFLGGMLNIMEHLNNAPRGDLHVYSTLYDANGRPESAVLNTVPRGAQFDLLAHGLPGWRLNTVGRVCSEHEGNNGDLDGAMVYYRMAPGTTFPDHQFDVALAMPFGNGIRGTQFIPFNTYQPSLLAAEVINFVANWIQLTNLSSSKARGTLVFHGVDGAVIGTERIELARDARRDFSGHQFGQSQVGTIAWVPDNPNQRFQLRNVRYYYDNPGTAESFTTALALEGMVGTGESIIVPLDTRTSTAVVEVANALNSPVKVEVVFNDAQGAQRETVRFVLAPFASYHLIADPILKGALGSATIKGSKRNSIYAVAMQYGRNARLGIDHIYAIPAGQALGSELRASYNTNLRQGCRLLLVNATKQIQRVRARMVRSDGSRVRGLKPGAAGSPSDLLSLSDEIMLPPRGSIDLNACANDQSNQYGVLKLQVEVPNSVYGAMVRTGGPRPYRFYTPLRE